MTSFSLTRHPRFSIPFLRNDFIQFSSFHFKFEFFDYVFDLVEFFNRFVATLFSFFCTWHLKLPLFFFKIFTKFIFYGLVCEKCYYVLVRTTCSDYSFYYLLLDYFPQEKYLYLPMD